MRTTGLKKATVASLVTELISLGWVEIAGEQPSRGGRPSQLLAPSPSRGLMLAMRIGLEGASALVVDSALTKRALVAERRDTRDMSVTDSVELLSELASRCIVEAGMEPDTPVLGASLAVPGIVDSDGNLRYSPGLRWTDVDYPKLLRDRLGSLLPAESPLHVENEANLAVLAEQRWAHESDDDFVYILGEEGVGGGVLIDGRLFTGHRGAGGEIGHMTIDVNGPLCSCGKRGCLAVFVSEDALVRSVRARIAAGEPSRLPEHELTSVAIVDAAEAGDAVADEELTRVRRFLVAGITNLASAYDPASIVIGGFLKYAFRNRLDDIRADLSPWLMADKVYTGLQVRLSRFEREGSLWGGAVSIYTDITDSGRIRGTRIH